MRRRDQTPPNTIDMTYIQSERILDILSDLHSTADRCESELLAIATNDKHTYLEHKAKFERAVADLQLVLDKLKAEKV